MEWNKRVHKLHITFNNIFYCNLVSIHSCGQVIYTTNRQQTTYWHSTTDRTVLLSCSLPPANTPTSFLIFNAMLCLCVGQLCRFAQAALHNFNALMQMCSYRHRGSYFKFCYHTLANERLYLQQTKLLQSFLVAVIRIIIIKKAGIRITSRQYFG